MVDYGRVYKEAKETEKKIEKNFLELEKTGIRVLKSYQCIYCGAIVDDFCDLVPHISGDCRQKEDEEGR